VCTSPSLISMSCSQTTSEGHRFPTPSYELNCQGCVYSKHLRASVELLFEPPGTPCPTLPWSSSGGGENPPKTQTFERAQQRPLAYIRSSICFLATPINFSRGKGKTSIFPPHSDACYWPHPLLRNDPSSTVTPLPQSNRTSSPQPGNPNTAY
jgi:hypothetical protein